MVLDGLPGLYGLKYDSVTACGLPLYLCSYKLVGSATLNIYAHANGDTPNRHLENIAIRIRRLNLQFDLSLEGDIHP